MHENLKRVTISESRYDKTSVVENLIENIISRMMMSDIKKGLNLESI